MRFFSAVRLCISKTHWQAATAFYFPFPPRFRGTTLHLFSPLCSRRGVPSRLRRGRRAHVGSSSLATDERDDGGEGRYWWKMKERTVCQTLPGCGGEPGEEIWEMLRSVSAGLGFTFTTAAEGSAVCTHLNLGFVTRHRQHRSLKPFCNENPLSRRGRNDISTSYLDLFAAPL